MKKLRTILYESIGDVWRSVARHTEMLKGSGKFFDRIAEIGHHFRYHNLTAAAENYHTMPEKLQRDAVDIILKNHSHYHNVHDEFHQHYKNWKDAQEKPKPTVVPSNNREAFIHHGRELAGEWHRTDFNHMRFNEHYRKMKESFPKLHNFENDKHPDHDHYMGLYHDILDTKGDPTELEDVYYKHKHLIHDD